MESLQPLGPSRDDTSVAPLWILTGRYHDRKWMILLYIDRYHVVRSTIYIN